MACEAVLGSAAHRFKACRCCHKRHWCSQSICQSGLISLHHHPAYRAQSLGLDTDFEMAVRFQSQRNRVVAADMNFAQVIEQIAFHSGAAFWATALVYERLRLLRHRRAQLSCPGTSSGFGCSALWVAERSLSSPKYACRSVRICMWRPQPGRNVG